MTKDYYKILNISENSTQDEIKSAYRKLARKYQIRDNEQVLRINSNGDFVITNRFEDKTKLLHRLMRYGDNCKVISPKSYVNAMKQLIDETLQNYS